MAPAPTSEGPIRIVLRFRGDEDLRYLTITRSFFSQIIGRDYDEEMDYIHKPGTVNMPRVKNWMVDCSVQEGSRPEGIPILSYRVTYGDDGQVYVPEPFHKCS